MDMSNDINLKSSLTMRLRHSYSIKHLINATQLCRNAYEIEKKITEIKSKSKEEKEFISNQYSAYVNSAVILSVASLESKINEFIYNIKDGCAPKELQNPLYIKSNETISSILDMESNIFERLSLLDKYEFAFSIYNISSFEKGRKPYQDVKLLINLRNSLIHYYPEYQLVGEEKHPEHEQHKFEKQLKEKFAINPFYADTGNPYYPDKCIGYGCAEWAVKSSIAFIDEFDKKFGIKPISELLGDKLDTKLL